MEIYLSFHQYIKFYSFKMRENLLNNAIYEKREMTREKPTFSISNLKIEKIVNRLLEGERRLRRKIFEVLYCILREYGIELEEEELPNFLLLMGLIRFQNLKENFQYNNIRRPEEVTKEAN